MAGLTEQLRPYRATRIARPGRSGLWSALATIVGDASVPIPDPVSDARTEQICAEEAQRAIFSHLASLQASVPAGTV
ncbi:MAG: hypothetical protein U5R31_03805 [Acidimicrobiia bacterium]|nr:hypothetical protein [Acidimicrobiia bacterium]